MNTLDVSVRIREIFHPLEWKANMYVDKIFIHLHSPEFVGYQELRKIKLQICTLRFLIKKDLKK